jgi:hypothetical protein
MILHRSIALCVFCLIFGYIKQEIYNYVKKHGNIFELIEMEESYMEETINKKTDHGNLKARKIVYYILGVLETLFAFRFLLKLLGANPQSIFVSFIYTVSKVFLLPFIGMFRTAVVNGIETQSVFEPANIIAMIVYALIAWGIVRLIEISSTSHNTGR